MNNLYEALHELHNKQPLQERRFTSHTGFSRARGFSGQIATTKDAFLNSTIADYMGSQITLPEFSDHGETKFTISQEYEEDNSFDAQVVSVTIDIESADGFGCQETLSIDEAENTTFDQFINYLGDEVDGYDANYDIPNDAVITVVDSGAMYDDNPHTLTFDKENQRYSLGVKDDFEYDASINNYKKRNPQLN